MEGLLDSLSGEESDDEETEILRLLANDEAARDSDRAPG